MSDMELAMEDDGWLGLAAVPAATGVHAQAKPWKRLALGAGVAVILGTSMYGICFAKPTAVAKATTSPADAVLRSSAATSATIVVDVHGDVRKPGVYTLPATARVFDAIRAAGGYLHQADADAVNSAAPVDDGAEIVVPAPVDAAQLNAVGKVAPISGANSRADQGIGAVDALTHGPRVDLNTADEATLETLPGIGPKRAHDMIDYRQQHGLYRSVADLRQVRGIGPATLSRLQPYLFIGSTH